MYFEESKLAPQDVELEKAVLGALMLEKDAIIEVIDLLTSDCFYDSLHQRIFDRAILPLFSQNRVIDILTITDQLKKQGMLNDQLSPYYLTSLTNRIASAANIIEHTLILKQLAIKRNLISFCSDTLKNAYRLDTDSLELLDHTAKRLDRIGLKLTGKSFTRINEVIRDNIREIELAAKNDNEITGIPSGFIDLDRITSGWQRSDLIILAARPGMGKTTLALNLAEFAAIEYKKKVAVFSLEMSKSQLGKKAISSQTGLELKRLRTGRLSTDDWNTLNAKISGLCDADLFIDDTPGLSVFELKAKCRRLKHEYQDLGLIVIDYLQLMNGTDPENKGQNREQQISYISRNLKGIAKELDVPVIALSQLSRSVETRGGDKKPLLSDLRESGAIEADADVVLFLYRPEYYKIVEDAYPSEQVHLFSGKISEYICQKKDYDNKSETLQQGR